MIGHIKLHAQNVTDSWDLGRSGLIGSGRGSGLRNRLEAEIPFMLEQQKKGSRNLRFSSPLRLSQSEKKALAEIRLLVGGSRQKHLWLEKSPAPHSFLNFETPLIIQYYNLKTSVICLCLREKFKIFLFLLLFFKEAGFLQA